MHAGLGTVPDLPPDSESRSRSVGSVDILEDERVIQMRTCFAPDALIRDEREFEHASEHESTPRGRGTMTLTLFSPEKLGFSSRILHYSLRIFQIGR